MSKLFEIVFYIIVGFVTFVSIFMVGYAIGSAERIIPSHYCSPYLAVDQFSDSENNQDYVICRDINNNFTFKEIKK